MTDCRNDAEEREFLMERWKLSLERIRQIPDETSVPVAYREYFSETAKYIVKLQEVGGRLKNGVLETADEDELKVLNEAPYRELLSGRYEHSYGNPAYAVQMLGDG